MRRGEALTETVELRADPDEQKTRWTIREQRFADLLAVQEDAGVLPARLTGTKFEDLNDADQRTYNEWLMRRVISIAAHGLTAIDGEPVRSPEEAVQILRDLRPAEAVPEILGELAARIIDLGRAQKKS